MDCISMGLQRVRHDWATFTSLYSGEGGVTEEPGVWPWAWDFYMSPALPFIAMRPLQTTEGLPSFNFLMCGGEGEMTADTFLVTLLWFMLRKQPFYLPLLLCFSEQMSIQGKNTHTMLVLLWKCFDLIDPLKESQGFQSLADYPLRTTVPWCHLETSNSWS